MPHDEVVHSEDLNKKEGKEMKSKDVQKVEKLDQVQMSNETISDNDDGESDDHSFDSQISKHQMHLITRTFAGVPAEWHETIKERNQKTQRVKLFFRCKYPGCNSVFKKSCNLRDHFRKHTG